MKKKRILKLSVNESFKKLYRIMRLTVFFSILLVLHAMGFETYSQSTKLNLELNNVTLKDVFKEIEKQSDFVFLYNYEAILDQTLISARFTEATVEDILDEVLDKNKIDYLIRDRQIIIKEKISDNLKQFLEERGIQSEKRITGSVKTQDGDPIPGVSIIVKGTTIGTITDVDGNFQLDIPAEAKTLQFSFVGMKTQEFSIAGNTTFNVLMSEETVGMDEVVVVAYGTQKKVNMIGSVAAVKMDEKISSRTLTNVSTGLSGLFPGLAVSQNTGMAGNNDVSLLIRGLGTVNNANPLIVVDGMPDVDINRLNINDVESISVLKDASSSAVYGSRAANGVILVTTKSGKDNLKTKFNFSSSYALMNPTNDISFVTSYPLAMTVVQRAESTKTLRSNFNFKDGTIDQWMALGMIDPLRYPNTDWWDVIIRTGQVINHNFSASGKDDKSNFYISAGIMDEEGMQINNDYTRYNARFNYDYKLKQNMNIGVRFGGNWSKMIYSGSILNSNDLSFAPAGLTPYDPETGYYGGAMAYNEGMSSYNPYSAFTTGMTNRNRQEVNPSIYWDWTPLKGLIARIDYSIDYYNQFTWNAPIPNTAYNFQTQSYTSRVYVGENAGVSNTTNTGYKTQLNGRINYHKVIKENHDINIMAVYSEEYWYGRYQYSARNDRLHPALHEIDAALTDIQSTAGNSSEEGLQSYIGRLNYTAFDKYLFEASFRYDGSSKFVGDYQFGFFPSAALGWRFTEEDFLKPLTEKFLSSGKFRISYGGLGNNSGVGRYQQQETMAISNYMIDGQIVKGYVYQKMVNRDLSWESTNIMNLGVDLGFLNNRLTTSIDYYNRLTVGMILPSNLSMLLTGGYEAPKTNIGELRNKGVEINLNWKDKVGELSYNINFNGDYNRNKLETWNEFLGKGNVYVGMPYEFVYDYEDIGLAQTWQDIYNATPQGASPGDILRIDLNGDGLIDENDKKAYPQYSRKRPTANFGLNTSFAWKGFDLAIMFQGSAGRKDFWLVDYNKTEINSNQVNVTDQQLNNTWSTENRDASSPRLNGNNNRIDQNFWLDDMSYIRLKNMQLGYTIKDSFLNNLGISNTRIYTTGENLLTFTKYRGLDPEKQGDSDDYYPLIKSFSFGINIEF